MECTPGSLCRNRGITASMANRRKRWCGRWADAHSYRDLSEILGKYKSAYGGTCYGRECGTFYDCSKEEREKLQIAICAVYVGGISVSIIMKKVRGSLTVEAALIIPLWLALCILAVDSGVQMYMECLDTVEAAATEEKLDAVRLFYICNGIGDMIENGNSLY